MPPIPTPLSALSVKNAKPGRYGDGNGLYLLVKPTGHRFWIFRYTREGRMREMGLGRAGADLAAVPLAEARQKAASLFRIVRGGIDPLAQRDAEAAAAKATAQDAAVKAISFRAVAGFYLAAHAAGWSNPKHRAQWTSTLAHPIHSGVAYRAG